MADNPTPEDLQQAQEATTAAEQRATSAEERATAAEQANDGHGTTVTDLQGQLTAAVDATRTALQAANPGLPESAFQGDTFETMNTNVIQAQAVEAHVREQVKANPAGPPPPGGGSQRAPAKAPEGTKGIDRIKFGLAQRN